MARGGRLPRTAGRPPRFLRTGHRRATSLSEAHLQAAQRDAGHTLGREAEGVLQSLLFHRASRGLRAQRATFRVLAEGDPDVDAALASAVGCSPPPRSLTPPRPPLSDPEGPCCAAARAAQIVRMEQRIPRQTAVASWLLQRTTGRARPRWPRCSRWAKRIACSGRSRPDREDRNHAETEGAQRASRDESGNGGARQEFGRQAWFTPRPGMSGLGWADNPAGRRGRLAALPRRAVAPRRGVWLMRNALLRTQVAP